MFCSHVKVAALEQARPVPVDFFITEKTRVLVITGPNTGGKTICLKTIGLASLMAKSGSYISVFVYVSFFLFPMQFRINLRMTHS